MRPRFIGIVAGLVCLAGCARPSNPEAEAEAVKAAETWIELVDGGNYTGSWDAAASVARTFVDKTKWEQAMRASREPFGKLISRQLRSQRYMTTLPGAPDGEYVVLQFATVFENKKDAVETVTPMREKDGAWRVSGYFIK